MTSLMPGASLITTEQEGDAQAAAPRQQQTLRKLSHFPIPSVIT